MTMSASYTRPPSYDQILHVAMEKCWRANGRGTVERDNLGSRVEMYAAVNDAVRDGADLFACPGDGANILDGEFDDINDKFHR